MKRYNILLFLIILVVFGCRSDGFKQIDPHASYRLVRFDSDSARVKHGDMSYFKLKTLAGEEEVMIYPRDDYIFVCDTNSIYWTRYLAGFSSGDSVIFKLETDSFDFSSEHEQIQIHVGVEWVMPLDINTEKERSSYEFAQIFQYLMEKGVDPMESMFNSIHVMDIGPGSDMIKRGDAIILHSKIYLLNDSLIYDSQRENSPLYFNVGQEGQVVPGVESALKIMSYESECEFVLPSAVAFGEDGSDELKIEAFTPLRMVLYAERQIAISQE